MLRLLKDLIGFRFFRGGSDFCFSKDAVAIKFFNKTQDNPTRQEAKERSEPKKNEARSYKVRIHKLQS